MTGVAAGAVASTGDELCMPAGFMFDPSVPVDVRNPLIEAAREKLSSL